MGQGPRLHSSWQSEILRVSGSMKQQKGTMSGLDPLIVPFLSQNFRLSPLRTVPVFPN